MRAASPPTMSSRLTTTAKTGRRMKRSETCMASVRIRVRGDCERKPRQDRLRRPPESQPRALRRSRDGAADGAAGVQRLRRLVGRRAAGGGGAAGASRPAAVDDLAPGRTRCTPSTTIVSPACKPSTHLDLALLALADADDAALDHVVLDRIDEVPQAFADDRLLGDHDGIVLGRHLEGDGQEHAGLAAPRRGCRTRPSGGRVRVTGSTRGSMIETLPLKTRLAEGGRAWR